MNEKLKELIIFIAKNSEQESLFLNPTPTWNINSHLLLGELQRLYNLDVDGIDSILIENQSE